MHQHTNQRKRVSFYLPSSLYHSSATPKTLSDDGCHPNPDTYFTMKEMALESIRVALKR